MTQADELDGEASVKVGHLLEVLGDHAEVVVELGEDIAVRGIGNAGARFAEAHLLGHVSHDVAAAEGLTVEGVFPSHFHFEVAGEGVDDGGSDAMEAAGDFVGPAAEFTAGVEGCHDGFKGGLAGGGVDVYGDAAPVVGDGHGAVFAEDDINVGAVAGHGLVNGVVNDFIDEVVEAPLVGAANVHPGPAADGLQPFQNDDVLGGVSVLCIGGHRAGLPNPN